MFFAKSKCDLSRSSGIYEEVFDLRAPLQLQAVNPSNRGRKLAASSELFLSKGEQAQIGPSFFTYGDNLRKHRLRG